MSFQSDKSQLENIFAVLRQQAASTKESWDDPVQQRFYEQFIEPLPKEFIAFITAIDKLDQSFKTAEQNINALHQ